MPTRLDRTQHLLPLIMALCSSWQTTNCLAVGTQSALLAGFAYSGLTQVAFPHDAPYFIKLLYMLATTTAMGFELIAVMNTTLLSMVGPGLALRGPDGSMHPAVDGMMIEYRLAFYSFFSGLVSFHLSAALFGWMMFWPDHCARRPAAGRALNESLHPPDTLLMTYLTPSPPSTLHPLTSLDRCRRRPPLLAQGSSR